MIPERNVKASQTFWQEESDISMLSKIPFQNNLFDLRVACGDSLMSQFYAKMIKDQICEVCKEGKVKYRCPKCQIVYCSLGCYKGHQDSCKEKQNDTTQIQEVVEIDTRVHEEFELDEDESEDKVSAEQLKKLEESVELRSMLLNPHLRQMITDLAQSSIRTVDRKLEAALREPIFTEFSDKCIGIIDNDDNYDDDVIDS